MTYQEFVSGPAQGSATGRVATSAGRGSVAEPNAGHHALARMQAAGRVTCWSPRTSTGCTRQRAPRCLPCTAGSPTWSASAAGDVDAHRAAGAARALNPGYAARHAHVASGPTATSISRRPGSFVVPGCADCGGILKPDVVFFGENVPGPACSVLRRGGRPRRRRCAAGRRIVADRHVRLPVRTPRGSRRHASGDRQPGCHSRRRLGGVHARRGCSEFLTQLHVAPYGEQHAEPGEQPRVTKHLQSALVKDGRPRSPDRCPQSLRTKMW